MSRLRASLEQLPAWPGLALGAAVILGLGSWYYGGAYLRCHELNQAREALRTAIEAEGRRGGILDLAAVFPGTWDEVRIAQAHRLAPGQSPYHCPLGWDLSASERQALIDAGDYTLIGFFERGRFQRYVEYRGDWARFAADGGFSRVEATFTIETPNLNGPAVLKPVRR
jgi:hypothetical protein